MPMKLTVISNNEEGQKEYSIPTCEERAKHFTNVTGVVCKEALEVWGEIWKELQGHVTDGCLILPEAENGFKPGCGWPEFLEKLWLLRHYIDYVQRFSEKGPR